MTREEALTEWVIPAIRKTWNEKKCDEVLKALEQEPKWIPVSERLPEEGKKVLVQCNDMYYNMNDSGINIGWRINNYWLTYTIQGREEIMFPVAWMPLPEPYRAESEDKK